MDFICPSCGENHPTTEVFDTYWYFARERHRIYESRLRGESAPWTDDPILQKHRFCNTFRAADRVTQDVIHITNYMPDSSGTVEDDIFRTLVFRMFNKPETFFFLDKTFGGVSLGSFSWWDWAIALDEFKESGNRIYNNAYLIPPASSYGHSRKGDATLNLIHDMVEGGVIGKIRDANSLEEIYTELLRWETFGPFISYQMATDMNFIPEFNLPDDFVVPGIGAVRGLKKCFIGVKESCRPGIIKELKHRQVEFGAPTLFGRPMGLVDIQNVFCETDKYTRGLRPGEGRRIKQTFKPTVGKIDIPEFPIRWGLNEKVKDFISV